MKNNIFKLVFCSLLLCTLSLFSSCSNSTEIKDQGSNMSLWYQQPAKEWMESMPIGNGRLGAMIYGGLEEETIALNEVTMWSGQEDPEQEKACGKEKLAEIRKLFFDGKWVEGNNMASEYLSGQPHSFGSHLPIGDLKLKFDIGSPQISNYKRELDLNNAITTVTFLADETNTTYKREYFCSNPDEALIIKLSADKKSAVSFDMGLDLLRESTIMTSDHSLEFSGQASFPKQGPGGVHFLGKVKVIVNGGEVGQKDDRLQIKKADEVMIVLDIRTNFDNEDYKNLCAQTVEKASSKQYDQMKNDHIKDYSNLFSRVDISFGENGSEKLPTDKRWANKKAGKEDPGLDALFFQYGRYLLIASSRENSPLPANLQGIWNDNLACNMGWTCDYHLDINTEQNYWASNITNLHECNVPLFNYIKSLSEAGEKTAMKVYGSPGWVAHTVANVWGYSAPGQSVNWGLFPTASAWIASHLWTEYCYTQDVNFLKNEAYPILKKNAIFLQDYMVQDPKSGYLMTGPSTSPENSFLYNGTEISLSMMPTCDRVLVYETFNSCIEASRILNIDADFRKSLEEDLKKLPPFKIATNGSVQEWFEEVTPAHPNHRHSSHLLALYPYNQISLKHTPELAVAAEKSIHNQLNAEGWEDVEWSRANMINFYARLKKPVEAYSSLSMLLQIFTRENLLTISPEGIAGAPYDIFIFDGNEAGISGMAEMLIQNHEGYIEFIPTLPQEWKTGFFKGLCVKGGAEVDLKWENSQVQTATVKATANNTFQIKLPRQDKTARIIKNGKSQEIQADNENMISVQLAKNEVLELQY